MKLLASGCSFIYGSELTDEQSTLKHSWLTYPALLAKHLNLEYICVAKPGYGNDSIARSVVENISADIGSVVVNWSYSNRFEFYHRYRGWLNLGPTANEDHYFYKDFGTLAKSFFANLVPEYAYYRYLADIVLLQDFLKVRQIPYIFSSTDPDFFKAEKIKQYGLAHKNLYDAIDFDHWHVWQDQHQVPVSFVDWAKENEYPIGPCEHPLEQAHHATFELIKGKL